MRHERRIGSWPPEKPSTPSTRIVGEPRKPSRGADSGVVTSRRLSSKPSSDARAVSRSWAIQEFGQSSKWSNSTFNLDSPESNGIRLSNTLNLLVRGKVKREFKEMRIGEVATRARVPAKTIRFWEELDLLPVPARTPSAYRDYEPA